MATSAEISFAPVRIFIANGHGLFRDGLRGLLESEGFKVVGETADGESVVPLAEQTRPDVILLDLSMPRQDGIEILRQLSVAGIPARTLLLMHTAERAQVVRALRMGAYGVIPNETTIQRLFESIRCIMSGNYWLGTDNVSDLVRALREDSATEAVPRQRRFGLTPREMEIITLVVAGYSNPEIAQKFSISEQTVKHHISNIFDKLGVSNRLELALFTVNHRLLDTDY
jgi:two-component system, NarL family, nitrate/nitrite response regulator NarL